MQENSKRWDLTTLSRPYLSRIEFSANHRRRIVAMSRKMSRICARVGRIPASCPRRNSARPRFSASRISVNKPLTRVRATEDPFAAKPPREKNAVRSCRRLPMPPQMFWHKRRVYNRRFPVFLQGIPVALPKKSRFAFKNSRFRFHREFLPTH
jgi:hypothetical protein